MHVAIEVLGNSFRNYTEYILNIAIEAILKDIFCILYLLSLPRAVTDELLIMQMNSKNTKK